MENLPKEIFFEERIGTNGIKCLDYKNESDVKYIREDLLKEQIKIMQDKINLISKENENLSKGYDDWHNLYGKVKRQNQELISALIEVQSYQMNYVQLARTTKLWNIAELVLEPIQNECNHEMALEIGYPKCLMCGKELPYKSA